VINSVGIRPFLQGLVLWVITCVVTFMLTIQLH
jgi:hypothetical protein